MFDFILQSNTREEYSGIKEPSLLSGKAFLRYDFSFSHCKISCFSHDDKEKFYYENESVAIFVYGKVFKQLKATHINNPLSPKEINNILESETNLLDVTKGNFCIILINKIENLILVLNDHFAIKPVYYMVDESQFIISTNLSFCKLFSSEINYTVILERLLFTYPISKDTYLRGFKFLDGGEEIGFCDGVWQIKRKFDLMDFIFRDNLLRFDIATVVEIFNNAVIQRANCSEEIMASLTGGLDGRAIVSVLLKEEKNFNTHSFGCRGGENTVIPTEISKIVPKINYTPYLLEEMFEKSYYKYGLESIYLSDGLSFFERANYPYIYNILSEKYRYVLSGLLGGELFGPVNMIGDYINKLYYDLFFKNKSISWEEELKKKPYIIKAEVIENCREELNKKILDKKNHIGVLKSQINGFLFYYYDLLSLGFRRYYGSEIHIERYYAENLTPFLDYDVLNYLFSTDYIKIFSNAYSSNPLTRRNSKIIQSNIITKNSSILGSINVDRNFKPCDLINPFKKWKIPFLFFYRKFLYKKKKPEFNQAKWNEIFYSSTLANELGIFTSFQYKPGTDLNIALSLALWITKLTETEQSKI